MQFDFFPSRTLTLYLARLFITRIIGMLAVLVLVLQTLDLLGESGDILAVPGNGEAQLWAYVALRSPQLIATFLPYSVLLATIITLATLNQNSEVIAMKAAGLSAHQILAPLFLTALVVSGISLVFNERVVTRGAATLKAWKNVNYHAIPKDSGVRTNVYLASGKDILMAATVTGQGAGMKMDGVTWYRGGPDGSVIEEIHSPHATYANPGWRLDAPVQFVTATTRRQAIAPLVVGQAITPAQVEISNVDADAQDIFTLARSISALKAAGRRTSELDGKWWHKLSGPLSAALMPLLGAVAAFGLARSGQLLMRAVIGMALGFAYFVVDNAALSLGSFGGYPPLIAAWAPFLLFALIGETVLVRTEE
jgi:lipopolysaccharide export system permease protein